MIRHARYGPRDRYLDPPPAGMCLSVFALVTRRGKVLVGKPRPHRAWKANWLFSWSTYTQRELDEAYQALRLPSSYLLEGEDPKDGLSRVMKDQLGVSEYRTTGLRVFSYVAPSDWYPGHDHWDLAFVYDVAFDGPLPAPPWWERLQFESRVSLTASDFGWNSDLAEDLGIVVTQRSNAGAHR